MAEFTVNSQRFDPYKNFKFRVKMGWPLRGWREQGKANGAAIAIEQIKSECEG
jgi:hypothetical protein